MRISVQKWAMQLALTTAKRSTCLRRAVGCVLLDKNNHVIATGYNGVARGQNHCNERVKIRIKVLTTEWKVPYEPFSHLYACHGARSPSGTNLDACKAIHAEQNALLQCKDVEAIVACYTTTSPCVTCTKLLLNTGCQTIYYNEEYPQPQAKELWTSTGRFWHPVDAVGLTFSSN